jgi:cholesterol transport system auxiliary component
MKTTMTKPGSRWSRAGAALLLVGACLGSGCGALSSKGESLTPRFFSPAPLETPPDATSRGDGAAGDGAPAEAAPELRIGRVEPAAHLEERIAYRLSSTELAYYEDRRWTEPPEQFVRRALESELFERRAFLRVIAGAAPTLDVEVLGFEELRFDGPEGAVRARLALLITLRDERHALLERTVTVEVPVGASEDAGPALASAMAVALGRATEQIAEQVTVELAKQGGNGASAHEPRATGAASNGAAAADGTAKGSAD